jgi:DNA-binding NarL/FixJ family response regulator
MVRIVLAEDHALVREGTRHMLEQHPDLQVVGEAADGEAALALIAESAPDVAILDLRMPLLNAIEVTRRVRERGIATRCLVLTAFDDDEFVLAAMESGVAGYLLKTVRSHELAQAVRDVHRGETVLHPEISRRIALAWARRQAPQRDAPGMLTPREMEILELASQGLRNKEIAQHLSISVRTVEGHLSTILGKLEVSSRTAAVAYGAAHQWFRMRPPDDSA